MSNNYKILLDFVRSSDSDLDEFTNGVIDGMNGNPAFPNPPIPLKTAPGSSGQSVESLQLAFEEATTAALQGGKQLTAVKNAARGVAGCAAQGGHVCADGRAP